MRNSVQTPVGLNTNPEARPAPPDFFACRLKLTQQATFLGSYLQNQDFIG